MFVGGLKIFFVVRNTTHSWRKNGIFLNIIKDLIVDLTNSDELKSYEVSDSERKNHIVKSVKIGKCIVKTVITQAQAKKASWI